MVLFVEICEAIRFLKLSILPFYVNFSGRGKKKKKREDVVSSSLLVPATEEQPKAGPVWEEKPLWSLLPATTVSHAGTIPGSAGSGGS